MAYRIVDLVQGSDEWHAWRKGKIGGSHIASIMGLNPFETPLQIYYRIMDDIQVPENEAMREGKRLEIIARDRYNLEFSYDFHPACLESVENPWMITSLDGYSNGKAIEIKCGDKAHRIAQFGEVPPYYYPQLQWIMYMMNLDSMVYVSFYNDELIDIPVRRDNLFIEKMIECVKEFYIRMQEFDPPPAMGRDYRIVDDKEAIECAFEYQKLCSEIDNLEKIKEMKRLELLEKSQQVNSKIGPLTVTRVVSKGLVQWKDLAKAHHINVEPFRAKSRESWRIA